MSLISMVPLGILPDPLIRVGIRSLLKQRLQEINGGGVESSQLRLQQLISDLRQSPIAVHTKEANQQHYEVPALFYERVLGRHLKYSSGLWREGVRDLDQAEKEMLELTIERAQIGSDMDVLDLGCGWGSFSLFAAERFPNARFTALSNSQGQRHFIERQIAARGLKNLRVLTGDINHFQTQQRFDRIVSVEMFEHMRNYQELMRKLSQWLTPDGSLFVHIFVHRHHAYLFEERDDSDWMSKYFFTGGIMPSDHLLMYFNEDLKVERHWRVSGVHYQKTANAWLANMDKHRTELYDLFKQVYGAAASQWWTYWRIFFMACAELWGYRQGQEWFVSHYRFRKHPEEVKGPSLES